MRRPLAVLCLLVAGCGLYAAGCATPIPPRGGPEDTTPPSLEATEPADGAVNVRAERIVLAFSENIDEGSAVRAFGLAPSPETPPEVRVRGRRVEVLLPDSLRANTTYVVTFDTNLRDLRNVALRQPITFAFATGPVLDRGRIEGRVLDPVTAAPASGLDVFAYALPDSVRASDSLAVDSASVPDPRTVAPDYRTQTGEDGRFALDYLRDVPFFVAAVADRDRNRRADPGEAYAVPYDPSVRPTVPDSGAAAAPTLQLFRTVLDTIPPQPLRVRARSDARFAIRFDETVVLRSLDPDAWRLADTTNGRPVSVRSVYADADPQQLVLYTDPLPPTAHRLWLDQPTAVADSAGNPARPDTLVFVPPTESDTLRVRFAGFFPEGSGAQTRLAPLDTASVRFNAPPDSAVLATITVEDSLGASVPFSLSTRDGVRIRIATEMDASFRVSVPQPDSTYERLFVPLAPDALGDLAGVVLADEQPVVVEAVRGDVRLAATTDATGAYLLPGLPEGEVRLRAFIDRNGNGVWDGGRLAPYRAPEPLRFFDGRPRVRPRWETVLDTLAFD